MNIPTIQDIKEWEDKVVVVRAGLNVPLDDQGNIADSFRIDRVLPTLSYLYERDAKVVVLAHIGRQVTDSLAPVYQAINTVIPTTFVPEFFAHDVESNIENLMREIQAHEGPGVWLLDNLRQCPGEQDNDQHLARLIAEHTDIYVNEAFSVSHRDHMSMTTLPRLCPSAVAGLGCSEEIEQLALALSPPNHSMAVVGGNKIASKIALIEQCLSRYETVLVGGALANTLYAHQGYPVGRSLYDPVDEEAMRLRMDAIVAHKALSLPQMVVCSQGGGEHVVKHINDVVVDDYIYDIAEPSIEEMADTVQDARLIVWNGPLGYYEAGYVEGTKHLLALLGQSSAQTLVGGGNTVDAVRDLGYEEAVSFLSTGGGAMVDYLTTGTLPALRELHLN